MHLRSFMPADSYMDAVAETESISVALDAVCSSGIDVRSRETLSESIYERYIAASEIEDSVHPTTWVGRVFKLARALKSCRDDAADYDAGWVDRLEEQFAELIRSLPQRPTPAWIEMACALYREILPPLGGDSLCCQHLASVIAGAVPANDNCHLRPA